MSATSQSQFTVICPSCRAELTLTARRLLVRVDADRATSGEVLFTCLACDQTVALGLDPAGVAALVTAGVTFLSLSPPVVEHPELRPAGPAFTSDDLLDLHVELQGDDWLTDLVG
jgi:hypothetical protein